MTFFRKTSGVTPLEINFFVKTSGVMRRSIFVSEILTEHCAFIRLALSLGFSHRAFIRLALSSGSFIYLFHPGSPSILHFHSLCQMQLLLLIHMSNSVSAFETHVKGLLYQSRIIFQSIEKRLGFGCDYAA